MSSYTISFYNDMGHLLTKPEYSKLPSEIYRFACEKIRNKLDYATDTSNLGCRFYILKSGLSNRWTYSNGITIDYSQLDKYDSKTMRYV